MSFSNTEVNLTTETNHSAPSSGSGNFLIPEPARDYAVAWFINPQIKYERVVL